MKPNEYLAGRRSIKHKLLADYREGRLKNSPYKCDCSNPAWIFRQGCFVCKRCMELEDQREKHIPVHLYQYYEPYHVHLPPGVSL